MGLSGCFDNKAIETHAIDFDRFCIWRHIYMQKCEMRFEIETTKTIGAAYAFTV